MAKEKTNRNRTEVSRGSGTSSDNDVFFRVDWSAFGSDDAPEAPVYSFASGSESHLLPVMTSAFLRGFHGFSFLTRSFGVCGVSTATVCSRLGSIDAHRLMVLLRQKTRSCGLFTARVISTASSLQRPVSGVSGGSAASCSGDDSSVVVSMVGQHVYLVRSSLLRLQHVFFLSFV
ncbi:hypothetical protein YC2023_049944 [Brassica napus]